jgi:hypothetical protein
MTLPISDGQWSEVDDLLFAGNPLMAIQRIREWTGLGISDAAKEMRSRYEALRRSSPDSFPLSDEEYWSGWCS